MKRVVHYKQGYKIMISGKFYEVSDGKRILYFGELRHNPTPQEVWNKTIGTQEEIIETRQRTRTNNKIYNTANCYR